MIACIQMYITVFSTSVLELQLVAAPRTHNVSEDHLEDCQVYMFDFLVLFILIRCQPFSFDIVELASIATLTKYISSLHID